MKNLHTALAAAFALATGAGAIAQAVEYNRAIRGVAVAPGADGPDRWVVSGVFTVEAELLPTAQGGPEGGLANVSTTVMTLINGVPAGMQHFDIQIEPQTITPCGGGCGQGATNGMAAALLCIDGVCQFPPLTANIPIPAPGPGDEITVLLLPANGAIPDTDASDDRRAVDFDGNMVGWNRRVKNVVIGPAGGPGGSFFDVTFDVEYAQFGMTTHANLGIHALLLINGQPTNATFMGCTDWIASPSSECTIVCDADCGTSNCGGQNSQLDCRLTENDYNQMFCACLGESAYAFLSVPIAPGDEITVVLRPAPGALPELPGFGDDDTGELPPACVLCPGDLNGDGIVNGADLAGLLAIWGICFPM